MAVSNRSDGTGAVASSLPPEMTDMVARSIRIRGVVQGVGFRPHVYSVARKHAIAGWVVNDAGGVFIHAEGDPAALDRFNHDVTGSAPPASQIDSIEIADAIVAGIVGFSIGTSNRGATPTAGISPDLPVCDDCLSEMTNVADRRFGYPYINCTNCGPRYSIVLSLPYDRATTTMGSWKMCADCEAEYEDPANRRFHAQPTACPVCGPSYSLKDSSGNTTVGGSDSIRLAAAMLGEGKIVAIKGIGGYHLACDAGNEAAVSALRERKFRKERPFAVMVKDIAIAREIAHLSTQAEELLQSPARPIVLARGIVNLRGVAPGLDEIGVMLPYTPVHHLLFSAGSPDRLVMTSANKSSEPIAYRDADALDRLAGIADRFLVGEREIARRVDDSVARIGHAGTALLRRSRGYSPGIVARIRSTRPVLAVGGDLKNTITLVRNGEAVMSHHIGDLAHMSAMDEFRCAIADILAMYDIDLEKDDVCIAHDMHPEYTSTQYAMGLDRAAHRAIQHHRAHVASVLAEHGMLGERVVGVAFDGTGYGDDGTIWGGEFFVGSVAEGFERVAHLRQAVLPGGDAAARYPVQAAAGFLAEFSDEFFVGLADTQVNLSKRFLRARELVAKNVRCFPTTSAGRLFDAVAAILGFTREVTYEGQAAIWLEQLALSAQDGPGYSIPFVDEELDYREALQAVVDQRRRGADVASIARAFHAGLARGVATAIVTLADEHGVKTAALSGGVFQNELLLASVIQNLQGTKIQVLTNRQVPANDGGLSLGQAALAT